jgi:hypothetical protein
VLDRSPSAIEKGNNYSLFTTIVRVLRRQGDDAGRLRDPDYWSGRIPPASGRNKRFARGGTMLLRDTREKGKSFCSVGEAASKKKGPGRGPGPDCVRR